MKCGLTLPYNTTRLMPEWARLAEEVGWDGIFLGDAVWTEDPLIALAAAAVATSRIRLGTMIVPVPLRQPWKIASESLALDLLSNGRMILGLGAGAVWMGWQGFPDAVTDTRARAGMLDETIDILTRLYHREQFDFDGAYYRLKLSQVDPLYYPPEPMQQPRIPIWVPGLWPRKKSMQRVLRCDGIFPEKLSPEGEPQPITAGDIREIKAYVTANRALDTPFDIAVTGKTIGLDSVQKRETLEPWREAGATWWIDDLIAIDSADLITAHIRQGPPAQS